MRVAITAVALWAGCCRCVGQVAHHTESKFHLEEALSGVYDVSLLASWDDVGGSRSRAGGSFHGDVGEGALPGARDKGQADDTTDTVHITSKYGRRFECRVPRPAVTSDANDDDAEPAFDPVKALRPMKGACLATTNGWWSYEICFGTEVKQFHLVSDGVRQDETSLGVFVDSTTSGDTAVTQRFEGGTICDLTGKPRETAVTYSCQPGSHEQVTAIAEASTCVYRISVVTNLLCPPAKSAARPIACVPLDTDVPSRRPAATSDNDDPAAIDSGDAVSTGGTVGGGDEDAILRTPVEVGDVWSGQYVCQGEQKLILRIIKRISHAVSVDGLAPSDRVVFAGVLGFRHTLANGVYRVRVVVDPSEGRMIVVPGPWVHQPTDFLPLGFKGSVDPEGTLVFGVLPECDNGPWSLTRKRDVVTAPTGGHIASMLNELGVEVVDVVNEDGGTPASLDDDSWPRDGDDQAVDAGTSDDLGVQIVTDEGAGVNQDAANRIRELLKTKLGKDINVKIVSTTFNTGEVGNEAGEGGSDEEDDEGDGGADDAAADDDAEEATVGPTPPRRKKRVAFSEKDVRRVVTMLTDQVIKANTIKEKAIQEAVTMHGKRLRMEQMYRGQGGRGEGQKSRGASDDDGTQPQ